MARTFTFELVSPERLLLSEEVIEVVIPGTEGEMTVMAEHAPVMTGVKPGIITVVRADGGREQFVVFGGFADITPDGCRLLAESATRVADLDRADLTRRIETVRSEVERAKDHESRTKAEEFLGQLTTLEGSLLPA